MPRSPDFAPARRSRRPGLALGGLLVVALGLFAVLFYPRYRDQQRARREAAEQAQWARAAAQRKALIPTGEPAAATDYGPARLAALQRGILAVAPTLGSVALSA